MSRGLHVLASLVPPLVAVVALVLGVEAFLRIQQFGMAGITEPLSHMAPAWSAKCFGAGPDGELMTPNCSMPYKGVEVVTNSIGLNDREVDESKPHYRIAVLGDSVTMAAGVAVRDLYHARMEDRLNETLDAPDFVELYNFGRGGRSTVAEISDFENALARLPLDAAIVSVTPGNVWANLLDDRTCHIDDPTLSDAQREFYLERVKGENLLSDVFSVAERETGLWAFNLPRDFFRSLTKRLASTPDDGDQIDAIERLAVAKFQSCARRMRELANRAGVDLAWVVLWYQPDRHAEIVRHELDKLGEPVTTTMGVHEHYASIDEMIIYAREVHPNADVNQRFADALLAWFDELGWTDEIRRAAAERLATRGAEASPPRG